MTDPLSLDHYYPCRFPPLYHPKWCETVPNLRFYFIENLLADSVAQQQHFLSQDYEDIFITGFAGALDDRFQIASLFYEYFFFLDDGIEKMDQETAKTYIAGVIGIIKGVKAPDPNNRMEIVLKDVISMLFSVGGDQDRQLVEEILSATCGHIIAAADHKERHKSLDNFEKFREYRVCESAVWVAIALIIWSYGVYLPPHIAEDPDLYNLAKTSGTQALLINDLYSYRVEVIMDRNSTTGCFYNSVPVIMNEQKVDAQTAMDYLKVHISGVEDKFLAISETLRARYSENTSELGMINRLVEGYGHLMSGNWIYSTYAGRYQVPARFM